MIGQKQKNSTAVLVFLKYPVPGLVKTRLAKTVGNEKACEIYLELLHQVFTKVNLLSRENFTVYAVCDPSYPIERYKTLLSPYELEFALQSEGNLGERLLKAFHFVLSKHRKALAIGTDCVALTTETFYLANQALVQDSDCILGPSEDGGYYLIGISKLYPDLFSGINWSTSTVFQETLVKMAGLSLRAQILEQLTDIDTENDYQRYLLWQQSAKTFV